MVGGGERVEDVVDDEQALVCSLGTHNPRPNSPASAFCVGEVTSRFSARLPVNGNCTRLEKKNSSLGSNQTVALGAVISMDRSLLKLETLNQHCFVLNSSV